MLDHRILSRLTVYFMTALKQGGFYGKSKNNRNIAKGWASVTYGNKDDNC